MINFLNVRLKGSTLNSPVAQSAERVTVNHHVGGSNPSRGAFSSQTILLITKSTAILFKAIDLYVRQTSNNRV